MIRPSKLPRLRSQTIRQLTDLAAHLADGTNPFIMSGDEKVPEHIVTDLRACDLYWISEDMTALAVHAGAQLEEARFAITDRPSPVGMAVFAGGLGQVEVGGGITAPVDAVLWAPGPDGMLRLWHIVEGARLFAGVPGADMAKVPPLLPIREAHLPVTAEPVSLEGLPVHEEMRPSRVIVSAVVAAWHLMQQPQIVDRVRQEPGRAEARSFRRAGLPSDGVTLVSLRRQYTPQDRDPDAGSDGRRYRNRWVVSGHWRTYKSDRYSEETRASKQWISSHVKGPDGAPLLSTEKVNVWRR